MSRKGILHILEDDSECKYPHIIADPRKPKNKETEKVIIKTNKNLKMLSLIKISLIFRILNYIKLLKIVIKRNNVCFFCYNGIKKMIKYLYTSLFYKLKFILCNKKYKLF